MIYIIRHGKTQMNKDNRLQGRSNIPLNEEGLEQVKQLESKLHSIEFSYVFSSPLKRAMQTAVTVAPYIKPITDERLIEMDYGRYEGVDLRNPPDEIKHFFSDFTNNKAPQTMEQLSEVVSRVGNFLEEIKILKGNILISTHAIAMKGALEYLTPGANGSYWSKYIGNCAIYQVENDDTGFGIPKEIVI